MQEYMGQSALKHGLTYNFLVLYLNGDNLYPHIRFSPPVFGEEVVTIDQKGGNGTSTGQILREKRWQSM